MARMKNPIKVVFYLPPLSHIFFFFVILSDSALAGRGPARHRPDQVLQQRRLKSPAPPLARILRPGRELPGSPAAYQVSADGLLSSPT